MAIGTESHGNFIVVTAPVEMDVTTTELKEVFENFLNSDRSNLVLDMSGTTFINSYAIGIVVNYIHLFRKNHGDIILLKPNAGIKKIMSIAGVMKNINIVNTIDEAKDFFKKG